MKKIKRLSSNDAKSRSSVKRGSSRGQDRKKRMAQSQEMEEIYDGLVDKSVFTTLRTSLARHRHSITSATANWKFAANAALGPALATESLDSQEPATSARSKKYEMQLQSVDDTPEMDDMPMEASGHVEVVNLFGKDSDARNKNPGVQKKEEHRKRFFGKNSRQSDEASDDSAESDNEDQWKALSIGHLEEMAENMMASFEGLSRATDAMKELSAPASTSGTSGALGTSTKPFELPEEIQALMRKLEAQKASIAKLIDASNSDFHQIEEIQAAMKKWEKPIAQIRKSLLAQVENAPSDERGTSFVQSAHECLTNLGLMSTTVSKWQEADDWENAVDWDLVTGPFEHGGHAEGSVARRKDRRLSRIFQKKIPASGEGRWDETTNEHCWKPKRRSSWDKARSKLLPILKFGALGTSQEGGEEASATSTGGLAAERRSADRQLNIDVDDPKSCDLQPRLFSSCADEISVADLNLWTSEGGHLSTTFTDVSTDITLSTSDAHIETRSTSTDEPSDPLSPSATLASTEDGHDMNGSVFRKFRPSRLTIAECFGFNKLTGTVHACDASNNENPEEESAQKKIESKIELLSINPPPQDQVDKLSRRTSCSSPRQSTLKSAYIQSPTPQARNSSFGTIKQEPTEDEGRCFLPCASIDSARGSASPVPRSRSPVSPLGETIQRCGGNDSPRAPPGLKPQGPKRYVRKACALTKLVGHWKDSVADGLVGSTEDACSHGQQGGPLSPKGLDRDMRSSRMMVTSPSPDELIPLSPRSSSRIVANPDELIPQRKSMQSLSAGSKNRTVRAGSRSSTVQSNRVSASSPEARSFGKTNTLPPEMTEALCINASAACRRSDSRHLMIESLPGIGPFQR